jgi:glycosyltransferase involved in cell wall biosynthesis
MKANSGPDPILSICIPSYNRPELLGELLRSVSGPVDDIEIVICEDHAPRRPEVRSEVERFQSISPYRVRYFENETNLGYDKNLRELIRKATGEFVMFMGDDDLIISKSLPTFIEFLRSNPSVGYVLRTYEAIHDDGTVELFKYFPALRRFEKGSETYATLFRKSVTISGFTFRRHLAMDYLTDKFDGTLLFQIYLMAEIVLRHEAIYYDVPIVRTRQTFRQDRPAFGSAAAEKKFFEPGKVTPRNSVNFMKGFFRITEYMDRTYNLRSTDVVRRDISKYSYPILSIQRKRGVGEFLRYAASLNREVGINRTPHYYLYLAGLTVLGEHRCDRLINGIKKIVGRTPQL